MTWETDTANGSRERSSNAASTARSTLRECALG